MGERGEGGGSEFLELLSESATDYHRPRNQGLRSYRLATVVKGEGCKYVANCPLSE